MRGVSLRAPGAAVAAPSWVEQARLAGILTQSGAAGRLQAQGCQSASVQGTSRQGQHASQSLMKIEAYLLLVTLLVMPRSEHMGEVATICGARLG